MLKEKQNLIGKKFDRLLVVSLVNIDLSNKRNHEWETICDCGNIKVTNSYCLKYKKTKSCGCYQKEMFLKSSVKYTSDIALNGLVYEYKIGAKKRNLIFELSHNEVKSLSSSDCYYCGTAPFCVKNVNKHSITYNGIDRVDNSKGYTIDNVVTCCKICNVAEHDLSYIDFINWVKKLSVNLSDKKII